MAPIRPFHLLKASMLPKKIKLEFTINWSPIFQVIEEHVKHEGNIAPPTAEQHEEIYKMALSYLRERISYVFKKKTRKRPEDWLVSYWSKHVKLFIIMAEGTNSDKAKVPQGTQFNNMHTAKGNQKRKKKEIPKSKSKSKSNVTIIGKE